MRKTQTKKISIDWTEIKNECRHTTNKSDTDIPATEEFIEKVLISEHSPIRLAKIKWRWEGIKSWVSVHFARHWLGWDKFISTQRTDRTGINRDETRQDTPVNMDIEANPQALINVAKVRLCYQASPETREYMEDLKFTISDIGQKELSNVLVPSCIYRSGCPEFNMCKERFWANFLKWCNDNDKPINTIQKRYDAYNEYFRLIRGDNT